MKEQFSLKQRYGTMYFLFVFLIVMSIIYFFIYKDLLVFIISEIIWLLFLLYFYLNTKVLLFYDNLFVLGIGLKGINLKFSEFSYSRLKECYLHATSVRGQNSILFYIKEADFLRRVVINFDGGLDRRNDIITFLHQKCVRLYCDEPDLAEKIFNVSSNSLKWKNKPLYGKWYYVQD